MMVSSINPGSFRFIASVIPSEGTPEFHQVPTLPGWQALLLLLVLVTILVLALYWNTRVYEAPEIGSGHGSSHDAGGDHHPDH